MSFTINVPSVPKGNTEADLNQLYRDLVRELRRVEAELRRLEKEKADA